jgi:hypothetical protein
MVFRQVVTAFENLKLPVPDKLIDLRIKGRLARKCCHLDNCTKSLPFVAASQAFTEIKC